MASSSCCMCPCASFSITTTFSSAAAPAPSPSPAQSHPNGGIVWQKRKTTSLSAAAACSCHRQRQGQNQQQPNSAPLYVPPALISNRRKTLLPCPRAELDSDTILAVGCGVAGIVLGIGIPVFFETQVKGSEVRDNDQPCFPCTGSGSQICRFCVGAGNITVELGAGEKEVSKCINCEGAGSITCTTCQGSGVQPRYLDRREYKDED